MNKLILKKILAILFSLLYLAVGFSSCIHAITFFNIANEEYIAIILGISFEIGLASCLFALLTVDNQRILPWVMTTILTLVQCVGNIFCVHKYLLTHSQSDIHYFTDSVLFFIKDPDPAVNIVMIDMLIGGLLPLVCLGLTSMVVDAFKKPIEQKTKEITESKIVNQKNALEQSKLFL